ncbi:hypothetical protein BV98_001913 [Sphingobium herbicidovorans NBRC 16415]|uniref:Uncharacterized protein n=1 Tax=Sphingobium herbicidovorans (strain ATCC 700291 / DSM 11019 / CCUG 56400 / KCTC 2939 / LMG 18315 / NBRC 16415 / MH) TaxID=1219045 RepID=A0A086PA30_SPHHM|nr:hypothetical protein [Sphingobium herbicidovorans]KFG90248.1 hypothetical protein BV98_001913 [Sphingobium herbicidovorans NBRC 16415]
MSEEPAILSAVEDRRRFLKSCGRFAATVPPAMTIMLSTSLSSAAIAASAGGGGGGPKGNNGVGNGLDPQPPGNPPINDGPGTGPGSPGNKGG